MKENLMEVLLAKAKGYTVEEVSAEYVIGEDGSRRLVKEKVQSKHYPPDNTALKSYLEYCESNNKYDNYSDEELEKERLRLIGKLKTVKQKKVKEAK
ncbi:MAG: hypothetical protein ACOYIQ_02565 [Christensenellales bacterium]|jgi:flavin-dependent dehydrogenase